MDKYGNITTGDVVSGVGSAVGDLGGAVSSLFGSMGAGAEAASYGKAITIEKGNAAIEATAGRIEQVQAQREVLRTLGAQRADVAASGFAQGGSAMNLLRSSSQQGALTQALIGSQTAIQENTYLAQATALEGEQKAAQASQKAGLFGTAGGILQAGLSIAALL